MVDELYKTADVIHTTVDVLSKTADVIHKTVDELYETADVLCKTANGEKYGRITAETRRWLSNE